MYHVKSLNDSQGRLDTFFYLLSLQVREGELVNHHEMVAHWWFFVKKESCFDKLKNGTFFHEWRDPISQEWKNGNFLEINNLIYWRDEGV